MNKLYNDTNDHTISLTTQHSNQFYNQKYLLEGTLPCAKNST